MRAALLGLLGLVASTPLAGAAAPPVYPWQEAGRHVGEVVTIEGMVAAAHGTGDTCVLEFAPDDPHALRVILLLPMFVYLRTKVKGNSVFGVECRSCPGAGAFPPGLSLAEEAPESFSRRRKASAPPTPPAPVSWRQACP